MFNVNLDATVKAPARNWMDEISLDENILGVVLVQQYNLKKGLELYGDRSEEATKNELQKIHDFGTYIFCVANRMVNGSQMTVTWHVDDLKISHKDILEVTKFLHYLASFMVSARQYTAVRYMTT